MLIYGFFKTSRPFSIVTKSFIYLSCTDILTAFLNMIQSNVFIYAQSVSSTAKWILASLATVLTTFGIFIFFTICVFRYLALQKPLLQLGSRYLHRVLLIGFLGHLVYGVGIYFGNTEIDRDNLIFCQAIASASFLLIIISILVLNIMSYRAIRANLTSNDFKNNSSESQKEAVNTLIIMSISYAVFNLPMPIYLLFGLAKRVRIPFRLRLEITVLTYALTIVNVGMNAVVYIVRTKKIRTFFRQKIRTFFLQKLQSVCK